MLGGGIGVEMVRFVSGLLNSESGSIESGLFWSPRLVLSVSVWDL